MTANKIKNIIMVVAIILCLALAGGWIAQTLVRTQRETAYTTVDETAAGMQLELPNAKTGVSFQSARIVSEDYAEYGISAQAETAYTLNATITPSNAVNKNLKWELNFANPSSSWAAGKKPTDYVTMTVSGTQATLSCKKAFGEPIFVTATSTANTSKSATCRLNYKQKLSGVSVTLGNLVFLPYYGMHDYVNGMLLAECRVYPTFTETVPADYEIQLTASEIYTVPATEFNVRVEVIPTDALISALGKAGYTPALPEFIINADTDKTGELENYFDKGWAESIVGGELTTRTLNKLAADMKSMDTITAYTVEIFVGDATQPIYSYNLHLDFWNVETESKQGIDNVTFDKSDIEF